MNNTDHNHQQCLEMFTRLSEYLDQEVEPVTRRKIEAHLERCPACKVCMETLKRTVDLYRNTDQVPLPDDVARRLMKLVQRLQD